MCVQFGASVQQVTEANQTEYHTLPGVLGTNLTGVAKLSPAQQFDLLYSPLPSERLIYKTSSQRCVTPAVVYRV